MDTLSREQRRRNMQAIRSKNTKIEKLLASFLWRKGIRYRCNNDSIYGKPDFTFRRYRIAVFCDSEFFHGKEWQNHKCDIKSNTDYWHSKIENNIKRDEIVNQQLRNEGWKVIRFWGKDIQRDPDGCVNIIQNEINKTLVALRP